MTENYIGIDYSPEMVAGCKQKYQHLEFLQCDARNLAPFANGSFDTVLFSWNGLDYVNHEGRLLILKEISRVLKPGGTFIFSSHNRDFPQRDGRIEPTRHPLKYLVRWIRLQRGKLRHLLRKHQEIHTEDYCILNDAAHEYKLMTYYISASRQIEQLREHGFTGTVTVFDVQGYLLKEPASTCEYLYYCVQKSG